MTEHTQHLQQSDTGLPTSANSTYISRNAPPYGDGEIHLTRLPSGHGRLLPSHHVEDDYVFHGQERPLVHRRSVTAGTRSHPWRRCTLTTPDSWMFEIVIVVFSVGCLLAIAILAWEINGTWLSNWTFFLQPGTLISILSTGCQSSMMLVISEIISQSRWVYFWTDKRSLSELAVFESASRGPLGAVAFLWPGASGLRPMIASGGALVTITALALGPFTQQIVGTRIEKIPQAQVNSTIPVANVYDSGDSCSTVFQEGNTGKRVIYTYSNTPQAQTDRILMNLLMSRLSEPAALDSSLQGAFYSGLFSTTVMDSLGFTCASGNCTWPDFGSVGICSTCEDVSSSTKVVNRNTTLVTPDGSVLVLKLKSELGGYYSSLVTSNATSDDKKHGSIAYQEGSKNLVSLAVAQWNPADGRGTVSGSADAPLRNWNTTQCSMDVCIKQYKNVSVV